MTNHEVRSSMEHGQHLSPFVKIGFEMLGRLNQSSQEMFNQEECLMTCPYPQCDGKPDAGQRSCSVCKGTLATCEHCGGNNRPQAAYCRSCGHVLNFARTFWPQAGGNAARGCTGSTAAPLQDFLGGMQWFSAGAQVLLEPVVASDLVLALQQGGPHGDLFCAYALDDGRLRWSCDTFYHQPNPPDSLSTPICVGAFAYYVTRNPNRLHRIDLSSGEREIVALVINGEIEVELPGDLCCGAAPLLITRHDSCNMGAPNLETALCLVLSTQGLLFIEIPKRHYGSGVATAMVYVVPCNLPGMGWSAPAQIGNSILATDILKCRILRAKLDYYPQRIPVTIDTPFQQQAFSPCMVYKGVWIRTDNSNVWPVQAEKAFTWTASDALGNLHIMTLFQEGDTMGLDLNMTGPPARPVQCGTSLCIPGTQSRENVLAIVNPGQATRAYQKLGHYPLAPDRLVCVGRAGHGGNALCFAALPGQPAQFLLGAMDIRVFPPYMPMPLMANPTSQSAVGDGKVLVGTDQGLFCYA